MATVRIQLRRGLSSEWTSVNPTLAAGEVGIETDTNTLKFGDGTTAWNSLDYALSNTVDDYQPISEKGNAGGYASLDSSGYVPVSQLPPTVKITVNAVANQAARLALSVQAGDIAIQSDTGTTYVLSAAPATTDGNWKEISATAAISSAIATHEADTTSVHGIANTALLATTANVATAKGEAIADAATAAGSALSTHEADTTSVHGIANTALLATTANVATAKGEAIATAAADAAADATSKVGAEAALRVLGDEASVSTAAAALASHEADTTSIHGISDTAALVTLSGNQTLISKTLTSPTLSGTPVAPTAVVGTDTTQIATTEFVQNAIEEVVGAAPGALNTLAEIATSLNNNTDLSGTLTTSISNKVAKAGDTMSGVLNMGTNKITSLGSATVDTDATNKLYVDTKVGEAILAHKDTTTNIHGIADIAALALTASPNLTGVPTAPTAAANTNTTQIATTAYALAAATAVATEAATTYSPLASPTFTGTVVLPSGTITSGMIADGTVATTDIADAAVTTAKIGDSNITTAKINDSAVTSGKIAALAVTEGKLADGAVTSGKIADGTVVDADVSAIAEISQSKISGLTSDLALKAPLASPTFTGTVVLPSGTITSGMIADGTIVDADLSATAEISQSKISGLSTSLGLKADIASPTFTGTVSGVTKSMVGLGSVDNTSDSSKPVSTAQQTALDAKLDSATAATTYETIANVALKAPLASPDLTGVPTAPTAVSSTNTTQVATTAYVKSVVSDLTNGASAAYDTLKELQDLMEADDTASTALTTLVGTKAPLASPTFTGTVSGITKSMVGLESVDNTADTAKPISTATQTALDAKLASATAATTYAPLASPTFTGTNTVANITVSGTSNMSANGVQFSDGTQTKIAVPSLTTTTTTISGAYNLSTGGLTLRDQLIKVDGAFVITIPTNATTEFPVGTSISFWQSSGAGGASFAPADVAVSVYATPGAILRALYSSATITKVGANAWIVAGDLKA